MSLGRQQVMAQIRGPCRLCGKSKWSFWFLTGALPIPAHPPMFKGPFALAYRKVMLHNTLLHLPCTFLPLHDHWSGTQANCDLSSPAGCSHTCSHSSMASPMLHEHFWAVSLLCWSSPPPSPWFLSEGVTWTFPFYLTSSPEWSHLPLHLQIRAEDAHFTIIPSPVCFQHAILEQENLVKQNTVPGTHDYAISFIFCSIDKNWGPGTEMQKYRLEMQRLDPTS